MSRNVRNISRIRIRHVSEMYSIKKFYVMINILKCRIIFLNFKLQAD